MSKGIVETVAGGLMIAAGVLIEVGTLGGGTALASFLIKAGAGLTIAGIGTMLAKGPLQGVGGPVRSPIAPWNVIYGNARVRNPALVYMNSFGDSDKRLDLIYIVACHPCEAVDALFFDNQRVQIGSPGVSEGPLGSNAWSGTSFTPVQQTINIRDIRRSNNVITVCLLTDIPLLQDGDYVNITHGNSGGILDTFQWTGRFPVTIVGRGITSPNIGGAVAALIFTYLCGGDGVNVGPVDNEGQVQTAWVDYGRKVFMEVMLGAQTLGQTFQGQIHGTPEDGTGTIAQPTPNPWTANCSLLGMTAVFLRLHYNDQIFANGLPEISFQVRGKNDIYDPRTSPPSYGYSTNSALCIADYLNQGDLTDGRNRIKWGFGAAYSTEIPSASLIAAANICDESVTLVSGATESRYTCNGQFPLSMKRGEVLQNLLTSCAGRLTYTAGQFQIWPASWAGVSATISGTSIYSLAAGPIRWKPKVSIANTYNGVKGTYIAAVNNWQPSDFPRYAQDAQHGYNNGTPGNDYDANLDADGGDRRWLDIQLPFTDSCPMAQRIAKIELLRRRQQGTGTFLLNMAGYQFVPMDVVALDLPYFGWAGKNLEVLAARLKFDKQHSGDTEMVLLGTEIDVQETDSSIYAWSIGEELSPAGYQQAIVPDLRTPAAPTGVVLEALEDGGIEVNWTAPADGFVLNGGHIEIEYQLVASPEGLWKSLAKMDPTITQAIIPGPLDVGQWNVQIRSVNAAGVPSAWVLGADLNGDGTPGPVTISGVRTSPYPWYPQVVSPLAGDVCLPQFGYSTFSLALDYTTTDASQNTIAKMLIGGYAGVNTPNPAMPAPVVKLQAAQVTGGSLPDGFYFAALCATDIDPTGLGGANLLTCKQSPRSAESELNVTGGGGTAQMQVTVLSWPAGAAGWVAYLGTDPNNLVLNSYGSGTPGTINLNPTTLSGTFGPPDKLAQSIRLKIARMESGGVEFFGVGSIAGSTITTGGNPYGYPKQGIDPWTTNQWQNRIVSLYKRLDNSACPVAHFLCTSNNANDITLSGPSLSVLQVGDLLTIRSAPTVTYNPGNTVFSDAAWGLNPGQNFQVNAWKGKAYLIIAGKGRGSQQLIQSNTATTVTTDPFPSGSLDSTSIGIIVEPSFEQVETSAPFVSSTEQGALINFSAIVTNYAFSVVLLKAVVVGADGTEGFDYLANMREVYLPGTSGPGYGGYTISIAFADSPFAPQAAAQTILVDTTGGPVTINLPPISQWLGLTIAIVKTSTDANSVTWNAFSGDSFNGQTTGTVPMAWNARFLKAVA